jgi:hypothetical protein
MMTKKQTVEKRPLRIWSVEITLTSGEGLQFFMPAKDEFHANQKADEYSLLAENKMLYNYYNSKTMLP